MALEALGVMDHLENLEKTTIGKTLRKQQESRTVSECRRLQGRYAELVKRREELKDKLQNQLPVETEDEVVEIVASVWKSRLETRLNSYRLTGVSATQEKSCLLIRFDTSYRGEFKEAYFLELLRSKRMGVRKHTIPAFIPLADIARDYLHSDLSQFLWVLRDYLRAYVIRREELKIAQKLLTDRGYLQGEITSSLAVDMVQFYLHQNTLAVPPLCVVLQFNNLLHLIPAVASIRAIGDEPELPDKGKWRKILTSGSLSQSLDSLCPEREPSEAVTGSSDKSDTD